MRKTAPKVLGHHAPPPRPTVWAAGLLAVALSVGFLLLRGMARLLL